MFGSIFYDFKRFLISSNLHTLIQYIPNGCLDAYEVKVNKDTFKYQANVKRLIYQLINLQTLSGDKSPVPNSS